MHTNCLDAIDCTLPLHARKHFNQIRQTISTFYSVAHVNRSCAHGATPKPPRPHTAPNRTQSRVAGVDELTRCISSALRNKTQHQTHGSTRWQLKRDEAHGSNTRSSGSGAPVCRRTCWAQGPKLLGKESILSAIIKSLYDSPPSAYVVRRTVTLL